MASEASDRDHQAKENGKSILPRALLVKYGNRITCKQAMEKYRLVLSELIEMINNGLEARTPTNKKVIDSSLCQRVQTPIPSHDTLGRFPGPAGYTIQTVAPDGFVPINFNHTSVVENLSVNIEELESRLNINLNINQGDEDGIRKKRYNNAIRIISALIKYNGNYSKISPKNIRKHELEKLSIISKNNK